jgi:hypothetical protein
MKRVPATWSLGRLLDNLQDLGVELEDVARGGSDLYGRADVIYDSRGRRVGAALTEGKEIILTYDTDSDVGKRVCGYVHERVHEMFPGLAEPALDSRTFAEEELQIEYLTGEALKRLYEADNPIVRYAAGEGLIAQKERFKDLGIPYTTSTGFVKYQSDTEGGTRASSGDNESMLFDLVVDGIAAVAGVVEKIPRGYANAWLSSMGFPWAPGKDANITDRLKKNLKAAYRNSKTSRKKKEE